MNVKLEVCVASLGDAIAAVEGGADRLELNCALELGGLTMSNYDTVRIAEWVEDGGHAVSLIAMARPRPGGFCYDDAQIADMIDDSELALDLGCHGVAFGILRGDGTIDIERCSRFMQGFIATPFVFHRAFDVTPDPFRALEELIDLGVTRVMTSGQKPQAMDGADLIAQLLEQAAGRIEILPAAGINESNVAALIARTGCDQVHGSFRKACRDTSTALRPEIHFGAPGAEESTWYATDKLAVARMKDLLDAQNEH